MKSKRIVNCDVNWLNFFTFDLGRFLFLKSEAKVEGEWHFREANALKVEHNLYLIVMLQEVELVWPKISRRCQLWIVSRGYRDCSDWILFFQWKPYNFDLFEVKETKNTLWYLTFLPAPQPCFLFLFNLFHTNSQIHCCCTFSCLIFSSKNLQI